MARKRLLQAEVPGEWRAVAERNIQNEGHLGLTDVLDPQVVKTWEKLCEAWDSDRAYPKTHKNPYHIEDMRACSNFHTHDIPLTSVSIADISEVRVRKELAAEEEKRLKDGGISLNSTSAASFVGLGLEIEESQ